MECLLIPWPGPACVSEATNLRMRSGACQIRSMVGGLELGWGPLLLTAAVVGGCWAPSSRVSYRGGKVRQAEG